MHRLHRQTHRHQHIRGRGSPVHQPARGRGPRAGGALSGAILVVDDDLASAELLYHYLQAQGFHVATAEDGNMALELGSSGDYKVVILDVHMPLYDGIEVLEMLRKRHVLHPIKVIALTGDLSDEVRSALERSGVDSYLTKPVDLALLHREVDRLMAA